MADWDEDSPQLRRNLGDVLRAARRQASQREAVTIEIVRPDFVGRFRGEPGVESVRVWVGSREGASPATVAEELSAFEGSLQRVVAALDARYPVGQEIDEDGLAAVIDLCAWAHAEWVRIHPFVNGSGRTGRILANALLMRYGIPPAVRLRPRPDGGCGPAAAAAMKGDWQPMAAVIRRMVDRLGSDR